MGKIKDDIIRSILDRAKIVDVVGDFVKLRKTGVRYTGLCPFHQDTHDGNFIVYPAGNCYRCFACDEKGGAVDFLMNYAKMDYPTAIRWLGKKYCIEVDNLPLDYTPPPPRPTPPPLPMLVLPERMVTSREQTDNDPLCNWLRQLPWDGCQQARLTNVLKENHVGHARQGHTIWWQIDNEQRIRTGKMMLYRQDGHRDKEARYNFDWIHATLFRNGIFDAEKVEVKPTLFGLHLLDRYPHAAVHLVESEKTAVIMATAYGNTRSQVWMACGGVENLSREKLAPIMAENRRIILYPDRDAIDKWRAKQANLRYDRMTLNVEAVTKWWMPEDGEKADIADIVVRMIMKNQKQPAVHIGEVMKENPAVKTLVEQFDLIEEEPTNG